MTENPLEFAAIEGTVELSVPAANAFVSVLRSVAAGLAARCDLTLDDIEDLRIAVDEACALLVPLAAPATPLTSTFVLTAGELTIRTRIDTRPDAQLNRDGFGWTVITALVNSVEVEQSDSAMTIVLTKEREPATQ